MLYRYPGQTTADITAVGVPANNVVSFNTPVQYQVTVSPDYFDPDINALPGIGDGSLNQVVFKVTGLSPTTFSRTSSSYSLSAGTRSSTALTMQSDAIASLPAGTYSVCAVVTLTSPYFLDPSLPPCLELTVVRGRSSTIAALLVL